MSELDGARRAHETHDSQTAKSEDEGHLWLSHSGRGHHWHRVGLVLRHTQLRTAPWQRAMRQAQRAPASQEGGRGAVMDADHGGLDLQVRKPQLTGLWMLTPFYREVRRLGSRSFQRCEAKAHTTWRTIAVPTQPGQAQDSQPGRAHAARGRPRTASRGGQESCSDGFSTQASGLRSHRAGTFLCKADRLA